MRGGCFLLVPLFLRVKLMVTGWFPVVRFYGFRLRLAPMVIFPSVYPLFPVSCLCVVLVSTFTALPHVCQSPRRFDRTIAPSRSSRRQQTPNASRLPLPLPRIAELPPPASPSFELPPTTNSSAPELPPCPTFFVPGSGVGWAVLCHRATAEEVRLPAGRLD
jgi:hypothetical protein